MKVKYIGNNSDLNFVNGQEYTVLSVERGWYRIVDPLINEDYLFPNTLFEVVQE